MQPEGHAGTALRQRPLEIRCLADLGELPEQAWVALNPEGTPFTDFNFLSQLETRGLVGATSGWRPSHLIAQRQGKVLAAMPVYEKSDSFGEFVFDWVWADACQRAGRSYFPKLVCAVPYTPVPGPRILAADPKSAQEALPALIAAARDLAGERGASSLHVLFPREQQARMLHEHGLQLRADCRFLWKNSGFTDFDDFLATFSARQRKNIRAERRKVEAAGIRCEWVSGAALGGVDWARVHGLCARTFHERGHAPYLDAGFFEALARSMPDKLLVNLACRHGELVAAAIFFRDSDTLYGRYWGSAGQISCLHFESCYYQGIDYAIRHRLDYFDPGTQGEHKLRRGFIPVPSWSLHWFAEAQLGAAIASWLDEERRLVRRYIERCRKEMPFRCAVASDEYWP